uniref:C-type lectin domain-containing protein n=1 Tax=Anisakis simplex TaxID=6269 RepID=A0A0M3KBW4_ANISI
LTTLTRQEWPFQQWIRPKNVLQFLIALMAQPLIDFSKYQDCFSTAPLFYEDVISDPDDTLKSVLDAYGISQLGVPDSGEFDVYLNRYLAYGADERLELTAVSSGKLQCAEDWTYSDHTGNCYRFFNKDTRWPTAEVMCVIRGGHNIAVHDLKDNEYIQQIVLASGKKTLWLGAAQFGSSKDYVWSDHSKFDFEHWQGGKFTEIFSFPSYFSGNH